ncbi:MAG: helix-turn-helix domain-containing protein [Patescibacteria group bacterium]|jgi:hypothetical protein
MSVIDVKKLRGKLGITQVELAQRLDVNLRTITRWESGLSKPRGSSLAALKRLDNGASGTRKTFPLLRIGICCEFSDTTLPVLGALGDAYDRFGCPVVFVSLPWDNRMLDALLMGYVDVVLYNEWCLRRYVWETLSALQQVSPSYESGVPYIAFSLPTCRFGRGDDPISPDDLLRTLWEPETVKIVPPADLHETMLLVRAGCRRSHGDLRELATQDHACDWHRQTAGLGVREFLSPLPGWADRPVAYIGGQDQRSQIELAAVNAERRIVWMIDPLAELGVTPPLGLRRNALIAFGRSPTPFMGEVTRAYELARSNVSISDETRAEAKLELARWRHLHGSGHGETFRSVSEEVHKTLPRTSVLSKELGRWLN